MELAPVPRRPRLATRGRILLALAVVTPITLFALVPAVLGLQRYVVADDAMKGDIGRGSLVIEREVPAGDLRVGDVITFRPGGGSTDEGDGPLVTRRINDIDGVVARTHGATVDDEWRVDLRGGSYSRVMISIPWVGYPFVNGVGRTEGLVLLVVPTLILGGAAATDIGRRRNRRAAPDAGVPAPH